LPELVPRQRAIAFLDRLDLKTLKSERLFRSDKTSYEQFLSFTGPTHERFSPGISRRPIRQTLLSERWKIRRCTAGEAAFASTSVPITHISDPTPEVRAIKKRLVKYSAPTA